MKEGNPDFFQKNMTALKKHHLNLWKKIIEDPPDPIGEIVFSGSAKPNLKIDSENGQTIFFHDINDPELEVSQFLRLVSENNRGTVIFQGMGLGYGPQGVLFKREGIQHLIIFELCFSVFFQAIQSRDLTFLFSDPRVILSVGENPDIGKALNMVSRSLRLEEVAILNHTPSALYKKEAYEQLNKEIFTMSNALNVAGNTFKAYGKTFVSNRLSFLSMIPHTSLIDGLNGKFKDIPAILVSSGPSLEKNIDLLHRFVGKAVILCVDSALPALLAKGIEPDFVSSIDYQGITYEKIASSASKVNHISLICSTWVGKKVAKIFPADNIFWAFTGGSMEKWLNRSLGGNLKVPGSGTVAHLNFIAALVMKCSPVVLIGQDLCLSQGPGISDHVEGAVIREDRMTAALMKNAGALMWVDANDGGKVPTERAYYGYIKSFEMMIAGTPGHYINATEGGAYIQGTEVMTLKAVLDGFCTRTHDISGRIDAINRESKLGRSEKFISVLNATKKTMKDLKENIEKTDQINAFLNRYLDKMKTTKHKISHFDSLPGNIQKKIKDLDRCHGRLDRKKDFWGLFDEATLNELRDTERMRFEINKIENQPEKYLDWLQANLKRLGDVNRARDVILSEFGKEISKVLDHYKTENHIKNGIDKETDLKKKAELMMDLVRLYMASEDLIIAKPFLEKIEPFFSEDPEFNFYMGVLASHHMEYEKADRYFLAAQKADPQYLKKIGEFRFDLGEEYMGYAQMIKNVSDKTHQYISLKGFRYAPDHTGLLSEIVASMERDMEKIEANTESGDIRQTRKIVEDWQQIFSDQPEIEKKADPRSIARFYKTAGKYSLVSGEYLKAFENFHKSLSFQKDDPESYILLADLMQKMGKKEQAETYLGKAMELDQAYVREYIKDEEKIKEEDDLKRIEKSRELVTKGNEFLLNGIFQNAIECYQESLILDKNNADAVHNMGKAYHDRGELDNAILYYEQAINIEPDYYSAYYNMGILAQEMGQLDRAISLFRKALALQPGFANAWNNLGNVYNQVGRYQEAIHCFTKVLEIDPEYVDALNNLGVVYQSIGMLEEAVQNFKAFLNQKPDNPQALTNIVNELQYACAWEEFDIYKNRIISLLINDRPVVEPLQSLRITSDPAYHYKIARAWAPSLADTVWVKDSEEERKRRSKRIKIRLGYLSSDVKDHAVAHIFSNFIKYHDKEKFEIFCYSSSPDNKTSFREKIEKASDHFVDIAGLGHREAGEQIFSDDIDILIEMNGYTRGSRLQICAMRPAPVQVSYLGFLGTTGADFMDYIITDKTVTPEDQSKYYSEKFAYLPDCYQMVDFSDYSSPDQSNRFTRESFGIPGESMVFCSFNQPYKFDPLMFDTWMNILHRVPKSILWLRQISYTAERNLRECAEKRGIDCGRIIFSEKMELKDHLKRIELGNIALDTMGYNGGATTQNALWAGLPVITLQGRSFVSRMASSSLSAMGLTELIAHSLEEYENIAVALATDPEAYAEIKEKIAQNRKTMPLFKPARFVFSLESLFQKMWERYLNGQAPDRLMGDYPSALSKGCSPGYD